MSEHGPGPGGENWAAGRYEMNDFEGRHREEGGPASVDRTVAGASQGQEREGQEAQKGVGEHGQEDAGGQHGDEFLSAHDEFWKPGELAELMSRPAELGKAKAQEALARYKGNPVELIHALNGVQNALLYLESRRDEGSSQYAARVGAPFDAAKTATARETVDYIFGMIHTYQALTGQEIDIVARDSGGI